MKIKQILKKFACFLIPLFSMGGIIFTINLSFISDNNYSLLSYANEMIDENHSFTFQIGKEGSTNIDSYKFEQAMNYFNTAYYLKSLSFHVDRNDISYKIDGDDKNYSVSVSTFPKKDADSPNLLERQYLKLTSFVKDTEKYNSIPRNERIIVDWKTAVRYQTLNSLSDYNEMIGKKLVVTKGNVSKEYTVVGIWDNRRADVKEKFENYFFNENFGTTFFVEYNEKDMYSFESFIHLYNKIDDFKKEYANLKPFIKLSNSLTMPRLATNLLSQDYSSSYDLYNELVNDYYSYSKSLSAIKVLSLILFIAFFVGAIIFSKDVIDSIIENGKDHSFVIFIIFNVLSVCLLLAECFLLFNIKTSLGYGVYRYIPMPTILSTLFVIISFVFISLNSLYYYGHKRLMISLHRFENDENSKNTLLKINEYLEEKGDAK